MWLHTKWCTLRAPDANTGGGSSPSPDAQAAPSAEKAVAKGTESAKPEPDGAKSGESPAPDRSELDAKLAEILKEHGDDGEVAVEEEKAEPEVEKPSDKAEEGTESKDEAESKEVPFHEHPRWKEQQQKLADATRQLEDVKPLAEQYQRQAEYCERFGITETMVQDALRMAALLNNDPQEARKQLQPILEALDSYTGAKLPPDLAQKVKDGLVDEDTAKELQALRSRLQTTERKQEMTHRQAQEAAAAERNARMRAAVTQWEQQKMVTDPDYKSKADLVTDRFIALVHEKPPRTPEEALALAEQALAAISKRVTGLVPKPPPVKGGINGASAKRVMPEFKSALEVAQWADRKHTGD